MNKFFLGTIRSLKIPPRTPADPCQTILLIHSIPQVTIFEKSGIAREENYDSFREECLGGCELEVVWCNMQKWSLCLAIDKKTCSARNITHECAELTTMEVLQRLQR